VDDGNLFASEFFGKVGTCGRTLLIIATTYTKGIPNRELGEPETSRRRCDLNCVRFCIDFGCRNCKGQ
jgi:hypothetical protein